MSAEGFFHDAHEVYCRPSNADEWQWVGTLATEELAKEFAQSITDQHLLHTELRPV